MESLQSNGCLPNGSQPQRLCYLRALLHVFACCVTVIFERSLLTSRTKVHEPKYKIFGISRIVATSWLAFVVTLATHMIPRQNCAFCRRLSVFICESVLHGFLTMVAWCASCFLLVQSVGFYIFIFTSGFLACIVSWYGSLQILGWFVSLAV